MKLSKLFAPKEYTLENGTTVREPRSKAIIITILLLVAMYYAGKVTGFNFKTLMQRGGQFFVMIGRMFPPNWEYSSSIWSPLIDTIKMSLLGSLLGSILVIPFAIIASSNIVKNKFVISLSRLFLSVVRTLPTLVTALIATYIFGLGTLAGTFAIATYTFAYCGKQLYEQIEGKAFSSAIIPQILPGYLASSLYRFEVNVRYASILGYVGAGGIGIILNENLGWREYSNVGMILVILFLTVVIIESVSYYLRTKLA